MFFNGISEEDRTGKCLVGETMKTVVVIGIFVLFVLGACTAKSSAATKAVIYKSPGCGCCGNYAAYLESRGFEVEVVEKDDLSAIKKQYKIPNELQSCHTAVIEEYGVEGHIPVEAIEKLVAEKPDVISIALPGMQMGTPGMGGSKQGIWTIVSISKDGTANEFMTI